jgi:hypothetical protein
VTWRSQKTPEGYVKHAIQEYLAAERIFYLRSNAGSQIITNPDTGKRRMLQMAPAGTADILALPWMLVQGMNLFVPLWIETKAPGKKQSPVQKTFERERIADGHAYIVAWSVEDVAEWLRAFRRFRA